MQASRFLGTFRPPLSRTFAGFRRTQPKRTRQTHLVESPSTCVERLESRRLLSAELVYDFRVDTGDPQIEHVTTVGDAVFLTVSDAAHGAELWTSDGTAAGTVLVKDIQPGPAGSFPSQLTDVGGTLYFRANGELWKSDGTAQGTVPIRSQANDGPSNPGELISLDGTLYFRATDSTHGDELWRSDGTPSGTRRVRDGMAGTNDSHPSELNVLGRQLYFIAATGANRYALFRSDGTASGTVLVKTINPGFEGPAPAKLVQVQGMLYFTSFDVRNGVRLWKSDGSASGTIPVAAKFTDVLAGSLSPAGDQLYFTAFDPAHGWELWKTDGTSAGTRIVYDIEPGFASSSPSEMIESGGRLFFTATTAASGRELWVTNGTVLGTRMVRDVRPGPQGASPWGLKGVGGIVFFSANDGTHGREIWQSDGAADGTRLFLDVNPGQPGSSPKELVGLNGKLMFQADDGSRGAALWSYVESVPGTPIPHGPLGVATFQYPTFHWSMAEGAVLYDLWVNDVSSGRSGIIRNRAVPENRFTSPVQLENGHTFLWTVRAVNRFGTVGEWAPHQSFRVDSRVAAPNVIGPQGPASSPAFTWTPVFGADRYDLWVNDRSTGQSGIIRNAFVRGTTFTPPDSLPSNHSYIWTVRGIDRFGTPGRWAAHAVFHTFSEPPAPELISPVGRVRSDGRPEFTWTAVAEAARYDLWVNNLTTGTSGVVRNRHVPQASFVPDEALPLGHQFLWTVRAIDAAGNPGAWAEHRTFTLTLLTAPVLRESLTLAAGPLRPTFTWPAVPDAVRYDLWVNNLTTGQSAVLRNRQVSGTEFTAPFDLIAGHHYIWTVRAIDKNGESGPWAAHETFEVAVPDEHDVGAEEPPISITEVDAVLAAWSSTEWWDDKRTS